MRRSEENVGVWEWSGNIPGGVGSLKSLPKVPNHRQVGKRNGSPKRVSTYVFRTYPRRGVFSIALYSEPQVLSGENGTMMLLDAIVVCEYVDMCISIVDVLDISSSAEGPVRSIPHTLPMGVTE